MPPIPAALLLAAAPAAPPPITPAAVIEAAPAGDWIAVDPARLLVMDLAGGGRVAILLAPDYAPVHVANIVALARAGWYDGLAIDRVQDGYVTQWGDADGHKPLPPGIAAPAPAEYDRAATAATFRALPYPDSYAPRAGIDAAGWPVAGDGARTWLTHCYGMVGAGRDNAPDTGTGAELYTVIGPPPRQLDRNIALVGRVVAGMEHLAALPRGTAALGFYATAAERRPIARVRLAADLPPAERPAVRLLRPDSASFAAWIRARANRRDAFYVRPAGALDVCSALPPVKVDR